MKRPHHISLDSVLEAPVPFDLELHFPLSELDREPLVEISPVRVQGQISRIEGGFSLDAEIGYGGRLECSRCLAHYPFRTDERFSMLLYKKPAAVEKEISLERGDLDAFFYQDAEVSLDPIAEERIQMSIPMKPLCREDCLGLCAGCGQDLNTEECRCEKTTVDPRWEALRSISRTD
jgi:uncharacterized protein